MKLNTFNLLAEEVDLLETIGQRLIRSGTVELCNDNLLHFEQILDSFDFLKNYSDLNLLNIFKLKNNSQNAHLFHIKISTIVSSPKGRKHKINDNYLFSYFETKRILGHVLIRPETIEDKINDFFSKTEIDFKNNPKFSSKYYMLSNNREQTENNINSNFLNVIEDHDGLHIEIKNNKVIATSLTNMNIDEADKMSSFCKRASNHNTHI